MEKYLVKAVEIIKSSELILSSVDADGRVNSKLNEDEIIDILRKKSEINNVMEVGESRNWFDIAFKKEEDEIFINIKVSECKTADNIS